MSLDDIYSGTRDRAQSRLRWLLRLKLKARHFYKVVEHNTMLEAVGRGGSDSRSNSPSDGMLQEVGTIGSDVELSDSESEESEESGEL